MKEIAVIALTRMQNAITIRLPENASIKTNMLPMSLLSIAFTVSEFEQTNTNPPLMRLKDASSSVSGREGKVEVGGERYKSI